MNFKKYFLLYTLVPLALLSVASSYYRFMVMEDYVVEYEGDCDPAENVCFIGCEDDTCLVKYHYSMITKNASHLVAQCGRDISSCEAAHVCLAEDGEECSISYCDPEEDGDTCETIENAPTLDNVNFIENIVTESAI